MTELFIYRCDVCNEVMQETEPPMELGGKGLPHCSLCVSHIESLV
jgi:hypothetical protein